MSTTPAGWYPDPEREGATRWWDGAQWAPSQDAAGTDDRFRPRDDADASATAGTGLDDTVTPGTADDGQWSPTPGNDWGQQSFTASEPSWSAPAASASAPSYGQGADASWGQQDATPAWQQQAQPTPQYGAPRDASQGAQQWNQYGQQPKKSRTGLFVAIGAGVLVLLLVVGGLGIWGISNLIAGQTQVQTQGGGTGGGGTGGGAQAPGSFEVTVAPDEQAYTDIEITTAGDYVIDVISTNDEDPRIELTGNGQSWSDDDGGDETYASRLEEYLDVGTYTLMVEEFSGDPLVAQVTIAQR